MVTTMSSNNSPSTDATDKAASKEQPTTSSHQSREKKKKGLSLSALKSPFKFLGKTYCKGCHKKCSGEVLRVNDVYFHSHCFVCKGCSTSLSQGGFFTKDKDYYCASCYQSNFGTKCNKCNTFVEGEVVTALGKTYHQNCFKCEGCKKPFPTGERVTFTGKNCLCQSCANNQSHHELIHNNATTATATTSTAPSAKRANDNNARDDLCAGCGEELKDGQALMALDKHFHVWCFKCKQCGELLHGEYMGKEGAPYCEKDYQALFGVKCTYCFRFISGKVLQAGDNNHFHPTCARCTKCGEPFGDGEEMFLQGAAIWHPRCGPGPEESSGGANIIINGGGGGGGHSHHEFDRSSTVSEQMAPYGSRASSPGAYLRRPYTPAYMYPSSASTAGDAGAGSGRFSRSSTLMGGGGGGGFAPALYSSSSTYSLRRPIEPGDKTGSSSHLNHFHLPASRRSSSGGATRYARGINNTMDVMHGHGGFRPVSAPPKPGYTQGRSATLPATPTSSGIPPYRTSLHSAAGHYDSRADGTMSQNSFVGTPDLTASRTYTQGFQHFQHSTPSHPRPITDHKPYPMHLLLTTNFKMPPDVDRCNLEKHLNSSDFEMIFQMTKDEFYSLPLWRRNDYKRRVKLF